MQKSNIDSVTQSLMILEDPVEEELNMMMSVT
jgi:hypothetical protein